MENHENKRTDAALRVIKADAHTIYEAFLNPRAVATWRPPMGMDCDIYEFEPKVGGKFRMAFRYLNSEHEIPGKTVPDADVVEGTFLELIPDEKIVELIRFESDDPAFAGDMTITTKLVPMQDGTEVTFVAGNVPTGIRPEDHDKGMRSTLANLAAFTEL
ncbi:MAG: SRPBCC domain-containing protein [Candidatus Pedobacter colombiensis]|uniref:SRPBCC domain-containing protein n=1 Tax=Candidatus Pedobacter colombiensis TaxID=3121371 RepID=A0AAJ5WCL6_9SPHI|nr:SRPBCC domain-containing protein [Pedobacter sp.]WEK21583.1 MAG: SRPBCC domain-containing protein [Pedobacter sp.]